MNKASKVKLYTVTFYASTTVVYSIQGPPTPNPPATTLFSYLSIRLIFPPPLPPFRLPRPHLVSPSPTYLFFLLFLLPSSPFSYSIPLSYLFIHLTFPPPLVPFTLPFPPLVSPSLTYLFFLFFSSPRPPHPPLSSSSIPFSC